MSIQDPTNSALFALLVVPFAFFLDALLVSIFGNSVGKAILGVQVSRTTGEALTFWPYAKRNLSVWAYGLGLCIPFFGIFTMISQARWLKKNGVTGYDVGRYRVDAVKLTPLRSISAALVILPLFGTVIYFTVQEQIDRRAFETGHGWTNPVTFAEVQVPAGWSFYAHERARATDLHILEIRRENLTVVFGTEGLIRGYVGRRICASLSLRGEGVNEFLAPASASASFNRPQQLEYQRARGGIRGRR